MKYLASALLLVVLALVAAAQCLTPGTVIYHPAPPVLIHSRVIEAPPAPAVKIEPEKAAEAPTRPDCPKDGCRAEATDEDQEGPQRLNFGVELGKLDAKPKYRLNGVEISRAQAIAAVEGAEIPDDVGLLRLTVIGSKEDRAAVLEDLEKHPALSHLRGKLLVQAYDPADPRVSKRGFVTSGKPTIYLSAPDGRVLARNLDGEYRGPEALAYAIGEAAGKPYAPDQDKPLPVKPEPAAPALPKTLGEVPGWAWIAAAAAIFLFLQNRKASQ